MNIQDIGAIAEAIAAGAVLITLVYLALQIKETRKAIVAQAYQARSDVQQEAELRMTENDALLVIFEKVILSNDGDGPSNIDIPRIAELSPNEKLRFAAFHRSWMLRLDNNCFQRLQGYEFSVSGDSSTFVAFLSQFLPLWEALGIRPRAAIQSMLDLDVSPNESLTAGNRR